MTQGIYGLGRFGTFWATVVGQFSPLVGYNRTPRPLPAGITGTDLPGLCQADTLWLCSSISSVGPVCTELSPYLKPGTLILDTCSVKVNPVQAMEAKLPDHVAILGTHPMFGPDSARNGLAGLAMVLSPVRVDPGVVDAWKARFESMGLRVLIMSPDEHDLQAARTQGVTHFIGRLLAELGLEDSPIATKGYQSIKEVMEQTCNDPWQLFVELQHLNPHGAQVRQELRAAFDDLWQRAGF